LPLGSIKRGQGARQLLLDDVVDNIQEKGLDLIALDDALDRLAHLNPRQSQVVVLRFFGGLTVTELVEQLETSVSTVESDWRIGRA
jgi:DNA-directed RNA polymerase specialized sigma24 family protein